MFYEVPCLIFTNQAMVVVLDIYSAAEFIIYKLSVAAFVKPGPGRTKTRTSGQDLGLEK